jgi:hypothetical protein
MVCSGSERFFWPDKLKQLLLVYLVTASERQELQEILYVATLPRTIGDRLAVTLDPKAA